MTLVPRVPATNPVLSLTASRTGDARDLIDAGVDVMVSADPRILEYAATRPELRLTALPADRTYLLLTTARSVTGASVRASADDPRFDDLRGSFARDVIRGPAASGSWWGSADRVVACAAPPPPVEARFPSRTASGGGRRIVYPSSDRLAGDIARRLVAIAAQERESFLRARLSGVLPELVTGNPLLVAAGLADGDLSASLMRGDDAAYVLPAPSRALDRCVAWRALRARAPWIDSGVPVVLGEAGASLIAGPNAPAITIDGSNTLRIGSSVRAPGNQR
jgi:hypothetical protein